MSTSFPEITLVRHGQTEWSAAGRHTGRTDIALTKKGEDAARGLAQRLGSKTFDHVWSSPSSRALETSRLAGFAATAVGKPDLAEWDYGIYEGLTTKEILAGRPDWSLFRDGCPKGESLADVGSRADGVVRALRETAGPVLIFSSSHFLRVLSARWLGQPPEDGRLFVLDTASVSMLGYEHDLSEPVMRLWNET